MPSGWRIAEHADAPFLYQFLLDTDPLWWRVARHGTAPDRALASFSQYDAVLIIFDTDEIPVGVAALAEVSTGGGTGTLELVSYPDEHSVEASRAAVAEIVESVFEMAPIRHLYVERFDEQPDLLTAMPGQWALEVRMPEFAYVDGRLADRLTFGLTRSEFEGPQ